jgi:ATP-binding cassette subfamily F protein uup
VALITLRDITVSFSAAPLLDHVNLQIDRSERIALIGRNGMGKSTLMKLIAGEIKADDGEITYETGCKIARLEQEVPLNTAGTIYSVVAEGLGKIGRLLARYEVLSQQLDDESLFAEFSDIQHEIDNQHAWGLQQTIAKTLSLLNLDGSREFAALSGGMKRRVLLGRALVQEPDVLLLDEPTNHLDIESILWLESFLLNYSATLIFITHDRAFLQKLANRIVELDRGQLTDFPGDYATYLIRKQEMLETEAKHNALFDKRLAQEEVWIRQGIKARRTRNEGRVRALKKLREERSQRREVTGNVNLEISMADRSGNLVLEAKHINQSYNGVTLINDFSTTIFRGDKIGIIGPNGCGKSTLLNILLGHNKPESGSVRFGMNLSIAYFDQLRLQLDPEKTVSENVVEGTDNIVINGKSRHIVSYLQDFLFSPQRARSPVKALSGGERNRLLLAKLFTKPANVIVMDEPTNDLDLETLELLEELLIDYPATLLLVSHDREFINRVVTSTIVFEGNGKLNEYVGGYDDWQRQTASASTSTQQKPKAATAEAPSAKKADKPKLSFAEQHEFKEIEKNIAVLEQQQAQMHEKLGSAEFYQQSATEQLQQQQKLKAIQTELEKLLRRWEQLAEKM